MDFLADYLEYEMPELVSSLLVETGQVDSGPINEFAVLDYLKLDLAVLDLYQLMQHSTKRPRGILSYQDKIVGVDVEVKDSTANRMGFTILHEIGHYVLPRHQKKLYVCNESDFSFHTDKTTEKEANEFAAEMLFKGDTFTIEANQYSISAKSIKVLKEKYNASFEATARRFVEKNAHLCCLVVFESESKMPLATVSGKWIPRYTVASSQFKRKYFTEIKGEVPLQVLTELSGSKRDFADSIDVEGVISTQGGARHAMSISFFQNYYNVFALIQPISAVSTT